MLVELAGALLAALCVCVVPGLFWSMFLCASRDLVERLAYSVALSLALVPVLALLVSRVFSTGVTSVVALFSVVTVFASGVVVWRLYGSPKNADTPLAPHRARLGLPTLAPLVLVGILLAALALGFIPTEYPAFGQRVAPGGPVVAYDDLKASSPGFPDQSKTAGEKAAPFVGLLVLAAGVAYALGSNRRQGADEHEPEEARDIPEPGWHAVARYGLLAGVFGLTVVRAYLGPVVHDWPYLRGVDQYEHVVMTQMTMDTGSTASFMLYPPGFHFVLAEICRLSGVDPRYVFPLIGPLLLVLPALACYAVARRLWGWVAGVGAAFFSGVIVNGTFMQMTENRFPNMLTAQFIMVMALGALFWLFAAPSRRHAALFATIGSSVVLFHQVATLYEAVLMALLALCFLPYLLLNDRRRALATFGSFAAVGLLAVVFAWGTYDLGGAIGGLLSGAEEKGKGSDALLMALGTQRPLPFQHLLETTTHLALWLGLLGALLVGVGEGHARLPYRLARVTLLILAAMMFIGSRTASSGFPERFERDLSIPVALFAGFAVALLIGSLRTRSIPALATAALATLLVSVAIVAQTHESLEVAGRPATMLPPTLASGSALPLMTPELEQAGDWLRANNEGGNIVATPYLIELPSRGMLAMGGYTGIQSYHEERIEVARDLPPSGAEPLEDALFLLDNPTGENERGETVREMQERYDLRYYVLYKYSPFLPWRPFAERDDLYERVFENEAVIIYRPTS